jgi:hypothetical protein
MGTAIAIAHSLCFKSLNGLSFARPFAFGVCLETEYLVPRGAREDWFAVPRQRTHRFGRDGYLLFFWIWHCCFGHTFTFLRCNLVGSSPMSGTYQPEVLRERVLRGDLCEAMKCLCYVQTNCWV